MTPQHDHFSEQNSESPAKLGIHYSQSNPSIDYIINYMIICSKTVEPHWWTAAPIHGPWLGSGLRTD